MVPLRELAAFLDEYLEVERYEEKGEVYLRSDRPVARLGLALDPWSGISSWADHERLDALCLHRPWRLAEDLGECGVLAYHLAFDEHLTTGYNPRLGSVLTMRDLEALGARQGRRLGMVGNVRARDVHQFTALLVEVFGAVDVVHLGRSAEVARVAVVGGMTDALVREASERQVDLYITGEWRQPGREAVADTGLSVVTVGHRRSEEWGLRALAGVLHERWAVLECVLAPAAPHRDAIL
ncbi:MAG: Nif3-like dinuclear metal center hexameric protein [Chloroflexota bacterium]|nr:Nif3-like dinuclear metal center hexameric protein [Chloroflexota bacterium]